jgi:hypothetical protein
VTQFLFFIYVTAALFAQFNICHFDIPNVNISLNLGLNSLFFVALLFEDTPQYLPASELNYHSVAAADQHAKCLVGRSVFAATKLQKAKQSV